MIGLDTNVVVRLFVDDDMMQAQLARDFVAARCSPENPALIDRVALCELVWVLATAHGYGRTAIADIIDKMIASEGIILEDEVLVRAAVQTFRARSVDFSDALMGEVNRARGCEGTATFDRKAAKLDHFIRVE